MDKLIYKRNLMLLYEELMILLENVQLFEANDSEKITNKEILKEKNEAYLDDLNQQKKGVWIINHELKNLYLNQRSSELFGYSTDEMIGSYLYSFMKDDEGEKAALEKFLQVRFYDAKTISYTHKDGYRMTVNLDVKELFDYEGNKIGTLGTFIQV